MKTLYSSFPASPTLWRVLECCSFVFVHSPILSFSAKFISFFSNSLPESRKMASESEVDQTQTRSLLERLIISRNRDLSLFLPSLLGLRGTDPSPTGPDLDENLPDPEQNSANVSDPQSQSERIILINPFTQGMVVVEGASLTSLLRANRDSDVHLPASKASIEALPIVEIGENEVGECVICLEEWKFGGAVVKELPCNHRFHGDCVEKWLGIHGSCPVCRFEMPTDQEGARKKSSNDGGWGGERGIWVSFTFSSSGGNQHGRNSDGSSSGDIEQTPSYDDSSLNQTNGSGDSEISN